MMHRGTSVAPAALLVGCVVLTSCGRVNFDQPGGDCFGCGLDAGSSCEGPSCGAFDPKSFGCRSANSGPFVQVAQRIVTDSYTRSVEYSRQYVVAAQADYGVATLRFDGQSFLEVDSITGIGWILSTWSEGDILYVASSGNSILVYRLGNDGKLTYVARETTMYEARHVWTNGSRLFATNGPDGLYAFDLAGDALTQVGTKLPSVSFAVGGWWDGTYHYFADNTALRVLTFDGSTFTQLATSTGYSALERVWGDGNYVYAAHGGGVSAFSFDGSTLELLDTASHGVTKGVWADGQHIFTASPIDGLRGYTFDGASFTSLDHVVTVEALDVYGDGAYVYLADGGGNIIAYAGFECLSY